VNVFGEAFVYLNDPYNWTRTGGILDLLVEHLRISVFAVLLGALLALPLGVVLGTTGQGGGAIVVLSNVSRAVPTLALLTVLAVTPLGFSETATVVALAIFAFPPMLTNTFVGFREVDRDVREAARAMGMSRGQVVARVEFPLAVPLIMTGVRTRWSRRRPSPPSWAAAAWAGSSTSASASRTTRRSSPGRCSSPSSRC
jgi:osmoprotectant transport system permease protein